MVEASGIIDLKVGDIVIWKGINVGKFDFVALIVEYSEVGDFVIKPLSPMFIKELESAPYMQTGDGMVRMPLRGKEWEVLV